MDENKRVTIEDIQQDILDKLSETEPGTEEYEKLTQQLATVTKQLNDTDRIIQEQFLKANELGEQSEMHREEMELKRTELDMQRKENLLNRIGRAMGTGVGLLAGFVLMEYSKEDVMDRKLWPYIDTLLKSMLKPLLK